MMPCETPNQGSPHEPLLSVGVGDLLRWAD